VALALFVLDWVGLAVSPVHLAFLFLGLTAGYATLNAIPSIFLSAPDESTAFIVLPGQRYLLGRRGYEAAVLTGIGGIGGMLLIALLSPFASRILPGLRALLHPHLAWILWAVIAWTLLSEWPKGGDRGPAGWRRWWEAWQGLLAGLVTFALSGLLGLILFYRSPLPVSAGYQGLFPAFTGLFAVPWLLRNLVANFRVPPQYIARSVGATGGMVVRGVLTGAFGGLFAAFFPAVTGGIGALIAGHATAQRDDRLFLISQGAAKAVFYGGGLLLFFVPGLHLTRGGVAWMLGSRWESFGPSLFYLAVAALIASGAVSFFLLLGLARLAARLAGRLDLRWVSAGTLLVLLAGVVVFTGSRGLLVTVAATGIGLVPVLWGTRRSNCMGLVLLPLALDMAGIGGWVAGWMGLV
jgi:putative membrane protein